MTDALGTVVVTGYLGAGKTTLVNHLLRHADGRRIAVMVNDFGEIGIDADLIESRDGDVLNLAGGCVCCSFGSDLVGALLALPGRVPRPDLVLIETSGVALPGAVARSARLARGIEVDAVVVLVDAETVRDRAADPYVGDTVLRQLGDADLVVVNKVDLVDAPRLDALDAWLADTASRARRIRCVDARVPPEAVLGPVGGASTGGAGAAAAGAGPLADAAAGGGARWRASVGAGAAADVFDSASFRLAGSVDANDLARRLADQSLDLVRAKGIVAGSDGASVVVQVVGPRARVVAATAPVGDAGRIVAIGVRGRFDPDAVRAAIDAAGGVHARARAALPGSTTHSAD